MTRSDYCLVKVLDYEAQEHLKKKRVLECKKCPLKEKCKVGEREYEVHNKKKDIQHR